MRVEKEEEDAREKRGRGVEGMEGETKAGEKVDEGRQREVSVNYCL